MYKYKHILFNLVMLISVSTAYSQAPPYFWITNVDNSDFPTVRVNYVALSPVRQKLEREEITLQDFEIFEDGVNMMLKEDGTPNADIKCSLLPNDIPLSVALAIDVTSSLVDNNDNINYLEWIQEASSIFVDSLDFENGSEVNTIRWAGSATADGWMQNEAEVLNIINNLDIKPGTTNFNSAFLDINGAIEQMRSAKENTRKVILFFTDGEHRFLEDPDSFLWEDIRDLCLENGIEVYVIETNSATNNFRLQFLAEGTGGEAYFVNNKNQLSTLFQDFFRELSDKDVEKCYLEYVSSIPCQDGNTEREVRVDFVKYPDRGIVSDTRKLQIPVDKTINLSYDNNKFYFSDTGTIEHTVRLTAQNGDYNISGINITPDNNNFSITPNNFTVDQENPVDVTISFDSQIEAAPTTYQMNFNSDNCPTPNIDLVASCNAIASENNIDLGQVPTDNIGTRMISIKNQIDEPISGNLRLEDDGNGFISLVSPAQLDLGPLEEKSVEISYEPTDDIQFSADLVYEFNSDCGPLSIPINGEGISGAVSLNQFNFGDVRQMTASNGTLEITNSGQSAITIQDISFQNNTVLSFGFSDDLQNQLPLEIQPGGTFPFDVTFIPEGEGNFIQGIVIDRADGNQDVFTGVLLGTGTLPRIEANDLNYATQTTPESEIIRMSIQNNNSSEQLIVGEVRFADGENAEGNFTILTNVDNEVVPVGGGLFVDVEFLPQSPGEKTATIEIIHNAEIGDVSVDEVYEVELSGELLAPDRQPITVERLAFGDRAACETHFEGMRINNPNDEDIEVSIRVSPEGVFQTPFDDVIISSGENFLPITFTPDSEGNFNATIEIYEDNTLLASAEATGSGVKSTIPIEIIPLTQNRYKINNTFDFQFRLNLDDQNRNDDAFTFYVDYNSRQLLLNENANVLINNGTSTGNLTITNINNNLNRATIQTNLTEDEELINVQFSFQTLLHNEDVTTVTVSAEQTQCFNISDDRVDVTVEGCVNEFSGVTADGNYAVKDIYPNPVTDDFTMEYSIAIKEKTKITLFDINGTVANVLLDEELPAGEYQLRVPIKNLNNGVYFIRIESLYWSETKKIMITK